MVGSGMRVNPSGVLGSMKWTTDDFTSILYFTTDATDFGKYFTNREIELKFTL